MEFFVYDNIFTYNKRNIYNGSPNTRLIVERIELPENGSFWFFTDMNLLQTNVNIQKRYVHIHPGLGKTNTLKFKKTPKNVGKSDLIYNPKTHRIEVRDSILPWKKPFYAKLVKYYGADLPHKKMSCVGEWFFNYGNNSMHFIIDYHFQKIKFHWEKEEEEESMAELLVKKNKLEMEVEKAENQLRWQNAVPLSDPS